MENFETPDGNARAVRPDYGAAAPPLHPPPSPPAGYAGAGYAGAGLPGAGWAAARPEPRAGGLQYELRPLSTGEILDRSFSLYRRKFWLYVGLSATAAAVTTLGTFVKLTWGFAGFAPPVATAGDVDAAMKTLLVASVSTLVTAVVYVLAYSVTQAATVSAVSAVYLGRETSVGLAFQTVRRYWYRYIGIVLWQTWSAMWLPIVVMAPAVAFILLPRAGLQVLGAFLMFGAVGSLVYSVIAYLRNSLAVAASVSEGLGVRQSMRRSKELVAGRKGRVFAVLALMYVLSMAAGVAQAVPMVIMGFAHGGARAGLEALTLLATFATGALVTPVGAIAFCLLYLDERVRREGFDVEMSLERAAEGTPAVVSGLAGQESPFQPWSQGGGEGAR